MGKHRYDGPKYDEAYTSGFVAGRRDGLKRARDGFWCGFCMALATWPLAGIAWVTWRVF